MNDNNCITIDKLLENENLDKLTVKMDVEGAEAKVLDGCKQSFEQAKEVSAFITCYHRPDDDRELLKYIKEFDYELSKGYMVNLFEKKMRRPNKRRRTRHCGRLLTKSTMPNSEMTGTNYVKMILGWMKIMSFGGVERIWITGHCQSASAILRI